MKVYIAGKLETPLERDHLEEIEQLCKSLDFTTFLPHRDVGLFENIKDVQKIFDGDITQGMKDCDLVVANLDGLHVGAGTAWELGYAYARGIPAVGLKTDESIAAAIEYLSAILVGSIPIVTSLGELRGQLVEFKGGKNLK